MGIRAYFHRGSRDRALGHFLSAPLIDFYLWYRQEYIESEYGFVDEYPEAFRLLDSIIEQGAAVLQVQTMQQAKTIDGLVDKFYAWCDWERPDILGEELTGTMKSYRYYEVTPQIKSKCGDEAECLWDYIRTGRAIGRPESPFPYTPIEAGCPNSFWISEEVEFLYACLLPLQGKFWRTFGDECDAAVECTFEAVETTSKEGIGLIIEVA